MLSGEGLALLHVPAIDRQFNLQDPDEGRLPWDVFRARL
jgi:hypothetical protein